MGPRLFLQEYKAAISPPEQFLLESWSPPEGSLYKVNVDGAIFSMSKKVKAPLGGKSF